MYGNVPPKALPMLLPKYIVIVRRTRTILNTVSHDLIFINKEIYNAIKNISLIFSFQFGICVGGELPMMKFSGEFFVVLLVR